MNSRELANRADGQDSGICNRGWPEWTDLAELKPLNRITDFHEASIRKRESVFALVRVSAAFRSHDRVGESPVHSAGTPLS
jgi:hypothetical protein